ncbi:MAG: 4-hydroxy-tetrahydrodipicolinate synthase [Parvibaculaceae bacterium]
MTPQGLWIPLITPFQDGELDETSLQRLAVHYADRPVDGLILAATTGEGLSLDDEETDRLVLATRAALAATKRQIPLYLGLSGGATVKVVKALHRTQMLPIDGYLIPCPYYVRPSQAGLFQHFAWLAENTSRPILIYNIPYRTGVNLGNETMLRLAEIDNIVGVKDCAADAAQSFDLLRHRPHGFSILTGEDALFYTALTQGADGGITASAHVETEAFATIHERLRQGDQRGALAAWQALADLPRLLFQEPSPAPVKHWLWRTGLIASPELRLPMVPVSDSLAARIDQHIEAARLRSAA